jgi:hypothetical protein
VLEVCREAAVESLLRRFDSRGIPPSARKMGPTTHTAKRGTVAPAPCAAAVIEAHLESNGVGAAAINVEVFVQARDLFVLFDSLMLSAQSRRVVLLREIAARRAAVRQPRGTPVRVSAV